MLSPLLVPLRNGLSIRPVFALRQSWREGYGASDLLRDLLAGLVVAMVALPLGMALAIASDVPPQHGLYTVIVGGLVVALLGGSRLQVTGPTAAFVVVLAPITVQFGVGGLLLAGMFAGAMLVVLGLARMGRLIQYIPHPVTTGFTAGITVVIATIQLKDLLGLTFATDPHSYFQRIEAIVTALPTIGWPAVLIGGLTLAILFGHPDRINRIVPAPLFALVVATLVAALLRQWLPDVTIATIGNQFSWSIGDRAGQGIPAVAPHFDWPWRWPGPDGGPLPLNFAAFKALTTAALAIAMLGAIESLLSAVVADGMARTRHDPDSELVALEVGNLLCPFFGGIAATGAIARTATNIRAGARSPLGGAFHALFVLVSVLCCAPLMSHLPMAALAALLLRVAWNMAEARHFVHIIRIAPRGDVAVLLTCFTLTILMDMVVGVTVGVVLAALLFMRRMAALTTGRFVEPHLHMGRPVAVPPGALIYHIDGPLFFGAAERAISTAFSQRAAGDSLHTVIFDLADIPAMDITALVAMESAVANLAARHAFALIAAAQPQPLALLTRAGLLDRANVMTYPTMDQAIGSLGPSPRTTQPDPAV